MSSSIYNHRSLQPQGPPPVPPPAHSPARVTEALDILRQEFELSAQDVVLLRGQKDDFENRIHAQINELNHIKQMVYELENQHTKARQQYEDDVNRLRAELAQARQTIQQAQAAQAQAQAQPPTLPPHPATAGTPATGLPPPGSLPPANASPHTAHAGMGHPGPAYGEPPYGYRGRDDVRERDLRDVRDSRDVRDVRDRDVRDRDLRDTRELRDRDVRDRDLRDREARERERELRDRDSREVKRIKTERPKESSSSAAVVSSSSSLPPPPVAGPTPYLPSAPPASGGAFLDDINPETLPPDLKKEGPDWFAVFNPKVKRVLDVNLTNTLNHESVVCCVRFSADGKYLATGCNRTAQIYDTKTGQKICVLNDESANPVGDLYIRSVCFSPDGKLLATGAEDKTIRIWEIAKKRVKRVFEGHTQEIYSLDFSKNGRLIVSGSGDRTTRIWDMETGMQKVLEINEPDGVDAGVTSVAISPDGRFVAAGSLDTVVRIWEVQSGILVERLKGHRDSVYSVAFTPDGKGIVSGSLDKTLKHWDISAIVNGSRKDPLPPPTTPTGSSSASASGFGAGNNSGAAARPKENGGGGERGSVNTLNFTGHKDYVLSVAVSHDGQWIVSGSKDRGVQFWEARTAQVQAMLQGHKNSVISIDLSPTGGILATGSGDMQARLWSYTTI
ncbi:TUP1 [Sanghuangporus sanghuang]